MENGKKFIHHAVVPRMEDYHISHVTGFMMARPLEHLPEYFQVWEYLGTHIPQLVSHRTLRHEVDKMALLDHEKLEGHRQQRLALLLLSFIGNSYIWQEGDTGIAKVVPRQLAIPWVSLATLLGLPVCQCYAATILTNCTKINPKRELALANMKTICQLPGGEKSEWFFLVSTMVDVIGIPALQAFEKMMEKIRDKDGETIVKELSVISSAIKASTEMMKRTNEKIDPDAFYNEVRPFMSGWGGDATPMVKDGIVFDGAFGNKPYKVIGGSAAQSPYIQCLDAGLGISHRSDIQRYLEAVRGLMLPAHADYIRALLAGPSLRTHVIGSSRRTLTEAYNTCVEALAALRAYHIQLVTSFIIIPSNKPTSNTDYDSVSKRGTGGQTLINFLKTMRNTTANHVLK